MMTCSLSSPGRAAGPIRLDMEAVHVPEHLRDALAACEPLSQGEANATLAAGIFLVNEAE